MRSISRFESNLLRILHAVLGRVPTSQALPILVRSNARPDCLSRDAVDLVKQALAVGCSEFLVRSGGWKRERFLCDFKVVEGRMWERREPATLGLSFSENSLELLIWLTETNVSESKQRWQPIGRESLTLGDQFLLFLTYRTLRNTEIAARWCKLPPFRDHGLCVLAFADDWGEQKVDTTPDLAPWASARGAMILESLQSMLAARWIEMERAKSRIMSPDRMRAIGRVQAGVLDACLDQVDRSGRRDLARFLLVVARELLSRDAPASNWIGSLDVAGLRVADRMETYRAAVAALSRLGRLQQWVREARNVAYHDDQYAASQLWKSDWEECGGDGSTERALSLVRTVEPMT